MQRVIMPGIRSSAIDWPVAAVEPEPSNEGPYALARTVVAAARRHKLLLAAWVVAGLGLALLYVDLTPSVYTASATLLLDPRRQSLSTGQDAISAALLDNNRAESELQVVRSERLLTKVFDSLKLAQDPEFVSPEPGPIDRLLGLVRKAIRLGPDEPMSAEDARQVAFSNFASRVDVRRVGQSYVAEVSYVSADPTRARKIANAIVSAYLWQSISLKADAAKNGAEFMQARINALTAQVSSVDEAIASGSLPTAATPDADARVIGAALQPLKRSSPRAGLSAALGGVLGLLGGTLAVMFKMASDRRIRTPDDLTRTTGLACLAVVPDASRRGERLRYAAEDVGRLASARPGTAFAAGIRDLRTSILLGLPSDRREGNYAVALVSWANKAGSTALCSNLARVIQDGGKDVTLIDADIHRDVGGSELATETTASLADALVEHGLVDPSLLPKSDGIVVLPGPSRYHRTNQLAYLGAPSFARIVADARACSTVVIDLPSLRAEGDARAAALSADAVVIVVAAGRTTSDDVLAARQALLGVGANVIGAVLNRSRG